MRSFQFAHSFHFLLAALLLITLTACGSAEKKRDKALEDTITLYKSALRWREGKEQLMFFTNPQKANLPSRYGMRVLDYEILTPYQPIDENSVTVDVRLSYLNESTQSISEVMDLQIWEWDSEKETWRRANSMPTPR